MSHSLRIRLSTPFSKWRRSSWFLEAWPWTRESRSSSSSRFFRRSSSSFFELGGEATLLSVCWVEAARGGAEAFSILVPLLMKRWQVPEEARGLVECQLGSLQLQSLQLGLEASSLLL